MPTAMSSRMRSGWCRSLGGWPEIKYDVPFSCPFFLSIVASAATLETLEDQLDAAGEDAQRLMFESAPGPDDDTSLGAEELRCR
jgi:hypothetical protein